MYLERTPKCVKNEVQIKSYDLWSTLRPDKFGQESIFHIYLSIDLGHQHVFNNSFVETRNLIRPHYLIVVNHHATHSEMKSHFIQRLQKQRREKNVRFNGCWMACGIKHDKFFFVRKDLMQRPWLLRKRFLFSIFFFFCHGKEMLKCDNSSNIVWQPRVKNTKWDMRRVNEIKCVKWEKRTDKIYIVCKTHLNNVSIG